MAKVGRPRKNFDWPSCMGGYTCLRGGYIFEYAPKHHLADKKGMVAQHRLVMEAKLGRSLKKGEMVHHLDGCKSNNSPQNLRLTNRKEHAARYHALPKIPLTESQVKKALKNRTTKEAAEILGCNHQTLRNRFPGLLKKRRSPCDPNDPMVLNSIRIAAEDPDVHKRDFAKETGISSQVAKRVCRDLGIAWKSRRCDSIHLVREFDG